jgi:hypothetical protein
MSKDTSYCDHCGDELVFDRFVSYTHVPFDVASANKGESAILCMKCGRPVTPAQRKAASDALYAWQGACNGLGVSLTLTEAYRAFGPSTDDRNKAAPVQLMLVQLCHLAGLDLDLELMEITDIVEECEKIAGFKFDEDGKKMWIDGYKEVEVAEEEKEKDGTDRAVGRSGHPDPEGSPDGVGMRPSSGVRDRAGEASPDTYGEVHPGRE